MAPQEAGGIATEVWFQLRCLKVHEIHAVRPLFIFFAQRAHLLAAL